MNGNSLPAELQRVHMVGIGGAGMSGVARILLDRGGMVSGSDAKESRGVVALRARGAEIRIGHDASSLDLLPGGPTAVVTTHAAIPKTNPELVEARRRGIPVILRPVVLAKLMAGYTTLMVTGTHGKTTTTSMLIVALQHSGFDPSFAVGGELGEAGTNAHHGSGKCFVAEADESDGSLLEYTPNVAVVTNIEADHLDFFGSEQAYTAVFSAFVDRIAPGGALVVCTDDPGAAALAEHTDSLGIRVLRYGSVPVDGADNLAGTLLSWEQQGTGAVAHIQLAGEPHPRAIRLAVPGRHMALNALGALLAAIEVGAPAEAVLDGLAGFEGVRRRFELVGSMSGVRVFDDYAHHPTEVRATLEAARTVVDQTGGRVIVAFQPHLYSRTATFATEFGAALSAADEVFVLDVYGAREQPLPGVSGATVAEHVTAAVTYVPDFSAVAAAVAAAARSGDVVLTMGAGDVTMMGKEIVTELGIKANRSVPGSSSTDSP
ncbi:UDP-N-acetylmuramate--L-alanine ligase [Mycolicibacterium fortuitum]|uniref:UDP-N-acetylmuramate--L-alanine ligase n=1 Tax=Mycolicibacterium fortuitum TaxID=1766 RepID=UPI001CDB6234|nr:UDP-N-acetylmuramate--L-alanine ligase [Mycolicibacterium fortuitum]UBV13344.1 UDP-N-acetylmuramate--L-alanine ligase [Mycolicibacterium fortuitum]